MNGQMMPQDLTAPGWGVFWALPAAILVVLVLWGLINCFAGYGVFRVSMVITGMLLGVYGGMLLVLRFRGDVATGVDYLVACSVLAVIAGLVSWLFYQWCFAIMVALCAVSLMQQHVLGNTGSTGSWVVAGAVGLAAGGIALLFPRTSIILITSLYGALLSVAAALVIILGGDPQKLTAMCEQGDLRWQIWTLAGILAALLAAGIYVQVLLARNVRFVWAPPEKNKKRKRKSSGRK